MSSVSVVVPCYNYARFLERCVASALDQTGVDVEVLIIDDCSTDDTAVVGASLAADRRVTFRRHDENQGHIATYNEGLAWASGDYTVLLSSDDLLVPGALARAAVVMDADQDVVMVYGRSVYFESHGCLPSPRTGQPRVELWDGSDWIDQRCRTATSCISSPEVVVRTTVQRRMGGYRPELTHAGDLEMWLRFATAGKVAFLAGVDQAYYRVHADSMMRKQFNSPLVDLQQRKAAFDAVLRGDSSRLPDGDRLADRSDRALAREALRTACRAFDRRQLDQVSVDELEAFALAAHRDASTLREYRGLQWRRRIGAHRTPWLPPVVIGAVTRRARDWLWWRRWRLHGV